MSLGRFVVRVIFSCKSQLNQQSTLLGFLLSRGLQKSYCKGTVTFGFLDNPSRGNIKLPSADKELYTLSSSVQRRSVNVNPVPVRERGEQEQEHEKGLCLHTA
ncbi:hypothetical protein HispidOSU_006463 [Sigmodon hispidus]